MRKAFPASCFLINPIAVKAYNMTLRGETVCSELHRLSGENEVPVRGPREWSPRKRMVCHFLFDYTVSCGNQEAFLIIRPYVRQISGSLTGSDGKLTFKMDGELLADEPITKFLIHDEQDPRLDIPLPRDEDPRSSLFYGAHDLDGEPVRTLPSIGHMAPNGTNMKIFAYNLRYLEGTIVEAGVIAARYDAGKRWEENEQEGKEALGDGAL